MRQALLSRKRAGDSRAETPAAPGLGSANLRQFQQYLVGRLPQLGVPGLHILHIGGVNAPGFVGAAGNLV